MRYHLLTTLLCIPALMSTNRLSAFRLQTMVERSYCTVFGSEDASTYYQEKAREALASYGITNVNTVPIKKMNKFGPALVGSNLYSFTMFGLWFNEQLLDQCQEAERLFVIYHEAAHYAYKHHQKLLFRLLPLPLLFKLIPAAQQRLVLRVPTRYYYGAATAKYALWLATLTVIDQLFLAPLLRKQEREADIAAVKKLREVGQDSIVISYMALLYSVVNANHGFHHDHWHYPINQQFEYIRAELEQEQALTIQ